MSSDESAAANGPRATVRSAPPYACALVCHPASRCTAVRGIQVRVDRTTDGALVLAYALAADLAHLRIPSPRPRRIAARLWEHTCCEVFIAAGPSAAYHEFNFSPSGEWAAHAFTGYRAGGPLDEVALEPGIAVRTDATGLTLEAAVPLEHMARGLARAPLRLALSTVVEDEAGGLSYWALKHPPGKPDFHHPDAFALVLDEIRD